MAKEKILSSKRLSDAYIHKWDMPLLVQIMVCLAPIHYLNQYQIIVNWNLRNNIQWNLNKNTTTFIQENGFAKWYSFYLGLNVLTFHFDEIQKYSLKCLIFIHTVPDDNMLLSFIILNNDNMKYVLRNCMKCRLCIQTNCDNMNNLRHDVKWFWYGGTKFTNSCKTGAEMQDEIHVRNRWQIMTKTSYKITIHHLRKKIYGWKYCVTNNL